MDLAVLLRCLPASCAAAQTGKLVPGVWDQNDSEKVVSEALSCSTGCMPQPIRDGTAACSSFPYLD